MNDFQKSCLGTILAIGLFFVVGLVIIGYSMLAVGGAFSSSGQENVTATRWAHVEVGGKLNLPLARWLKPSADNEKCVETH